jgi:hypothetical protein
MHEPETGLDEHGTKDQPTHHDISRRAYERFLPRGAIHGRDVEDWLDAERELRRADRDE